MSKFRRLIMQRKSAPTPPEKPNLATVTECDVSFDGLVARVESQTPLRANLKANQIYDIEFDFIGKVTEVNGTSNIYIRCYKANILGINNRPLVLNRLVTNEPSEDSGHIKNQFKARKNLGDSDVIITIDAQNSKGNLIVTNLKIAEA